MNNSISANPNNELSNVENPSDVVAARPSKLAHYVELTKPRISIMVLMTVLVAAFIAGAGTHMWTVFNAMVGTLLIAASGSALNQYLERWSDWKMVRTNKRPLPAQHLSSTEVAVFGAITFGCGVSYLMATVNLSALVLGLATWVLYVWIYTPMKRVTWTNTIVGAVAGALPILMGSAAVNDTWNVAAVGFFSVLLLWQFPHFMAIAWKYRHDYDTGGLKMLTVTDPSGKQAGILAIVTAVLLLPTSLISVFAISSLGWLFAVPVILIGAAYTHFSIAFYRDRNDKTAKKLLRSSLLYLPIYMLLLIAATCMENVVPYFGVAANELQFLLGMAG